MQISLGVVDLKNSPYFISDSVNAIKIGPRSQENELPSDNCHWRDPIRKFLPPVKHSVQSEPQAAASPRHRPRNGIIKPLLSSTNRTLLVTKQHKMILNIISERTPFNYSS